MSTVTTHELTETLIEHERRKSKSPLVFSEVALSGSWGSDGRLDVVCLTIASGYRATSIHGYEIKATVSDLRRDIDTMKWMKYAKTCNRISFAIPAGLVRLEEIPKELGVLTYNGRGWSVARRASDLGGAQKPDTFLRLLRQADQTNAFLRRELVNERERESNLDRQKRILAYKEDHQVGQELSDRFRRALWDLERRERKVDEAETRLKELMTAAEGVPEFLDDVEHILRYMQDAIRPGDYHFQKTRHIIGREVLHELRASIEERVAEKHVTEADDNGGP